MIFQDYILECCGVHGFYELPDSKEKFISEILCYSSELPYPRYYNESQDREVIRRSEGILGAMMVVTTNNHQIRQEKYLKEFKFKPVMKNRNTNSGNIVTLWAIKMQSFDRLIKKWQKEAKANAKR